MKIEIPKYNYTEEQLDELQELISFYQYEFDTPENRKMMLEEVSTKVDEFIRINRETKINQVLPDGTSEIQ